MPEFKIEGDSLRREARFRVLSWGTILLLTAVAILLFVLGVLGNLGANPNLRLLFVFTGLGTVIGVCILACREALHCAEREMVFVLDGNKIVRKRQGYPEVEIAFSEMEMLSEELGGLIINSTEPRRKIAVPNNVRGYEVIRAELAKHHALSPRVKIPLKSAALVAISILSWAAVLWLHDLKAVIPAGILAVMSLAFASYRLWNLPHRGPKRIFLLFCLGLAWFTAILLICLRMVLTCPPGSAQEQV